MEGELSRKNIIDIFGSSWSIQDLGQGKFPPIGPIFNLI